MRVYRKNAPKIDINKLETCDGRFTYFHEGEEIAYTFYMWCDAKNRNLFWYAVTPGDLETASAMYLEGDDLSFRHQSMDKWYSVSNSIPVDDVPILIEKLLKIRSDYEAEKALLVMQ